jgi:hypothetical protein
VTCITATLNGWRYCCDHHSHYSQGSTAMTQPDRLARNALPVELSERQLDQVAGGTGSQSSGAGAGKVSFNPFVITKHIDVATPKLS